jgi:hypothetical protein
MKKYLIAENQLIIIKDEILGKYFTIYWKNSMI